MSDAALTQKRYFASMTLPPRFLLWFFIQA